MFSKIKKFREFIGKKVWGYLWITAFLGPLWFAAESSLVYILQGFLFSVGLLKIEQTFLPSWYPTSLSATVVLLILIGFVRACVHMMRIHFSNLTQVSFTCHQRKNLLSYGLNNAEKISSKEILSLFTEIITQSGGVILNLALLVNLCVSSVLLLGTGFVLAPIEMIIGILLLLLFLYPLKYMSNKINVSGFGLVKEWENIGEFLLLGLKNNFFLRIYNQVDPEINKASGSLKNYQNHFMHYSRISGFVNAFPLFIGVIVLSCITYVSVAYIKTESMKLISFFYIFIRLAQASSEASSTFSSFRLNLPGLLKLYQWHEKRVIDEGERLKQNEKEFKKIQGSEISVELENLGFHYPNSPMLFQDLNIKIKKRDALIIKGESGTGKSTLLSIILGLNTPTNGKVLINNIDTSTAKIELHSIMGYVGPEAYLIQGTIRENLLYGFEGVAPSDEEIYEALKIVDLKDFVLKLPNKIQEPIHDVAQLSTGQKQRLSFARAILRRPSLFILDEATANLDSATEKRIIENLKFIFENSCTIIVTHKDSFDDVATKQINLRRE